MASHPLSGKRIAKLCYQPHPAHRALLEGVGAAMVSGWAMSWAKGSSLKRRLYSRLSAVLAPLDALRLRGRYDYIVPPPYALPLGYWLKRWSPQTRLILINADSFFWGYQAMGSCSRRYFDVYLRSLDGILSGSRLVDTLARRVCAVPSRIFHPFIHDSFFTAINAEARDVMIIGNLAPHKATLRAMDTYAQARRETPLGTLYIAGDGPQRAAVEEKAHTMVDVSVLGALDRATLQRYLSNTLFLLHLADNESWGIVVWEAAAAGVIPLVTDEVGAAEALPKELVVSTGDRQNEAVAAIKRIVSMDAHERDALHRGLQQTARQFTPELCTAEFRQSFADLIAEIERRRAYVA